MMMGMMAFGLIVPLLLIAVVAYSLGWRPRFNQTGPAQTSEPPLETLKIRHARGEINRAGILNVNGSLWDDVIKEPSNHQ